jgi:hypothetical protein
MNGILRRDRQRGNEASSIKPRSSWHSFEAFLASLQFHFRARGRAHQLASILGALRSPAAP